MMTSPQMKTCDSRRSQQTLWLKTENSDDDNFGSFSICLTTHTNICLGLNRGPNNVDFVDLRGYTKGNNELFWIWSGNKLNNFNRQSYCATNSPSQFSRALKMTPCRDGGSAMNVTLIDV